MNDRPRALFLALREASYVRNLVTVRSLEANGYEVTVVAPEGRSYAARLSRFLLRFLPLHMARLKRFDVVVVGFLGQPIMLLLRLLPRPRVILDFFVSMHETLVEDRQVVDAGSARARLWEKIDRVALQAADCILVDTEENAEFYAQKYGADPGKVVSLPVGADESIFFPRDTTRNPQTVFCYSSNLPLHGLSVALEAARLLEVEGIRFRIAGLAPAAGHPSNVDALGWLSTDNLAREASAATACLAGHFSTSPKA
jgi:glycosyltransferase involved in cell wall biosynthesis